MKEKIKKKITIICLIGIVVLLSINLGNMIYKKKVPPRVGVSTLEYDFNTIKQNSEAKFTFVIYNVGKKPLHIGEVVTSYGCTVVAINRKEIAADDTTALTVTYNTEQVGDFKKTILVRNNSINDNKLILKIKGKVVE